MLRVNFTLQVALGAAALVLAALLAPASAQADPAHIYGIHWYGDPSSNDAESLSGGRALWVLETVNLYESGWTMSDQAARMQAVVAKGHTVCIRLQPRWGYAIPATPAERAQYLIDVENAAQQAAGFCHIWQIGNEMNLYGEYGNQQLSPSDYVSYFKQVRAAIKKVTGPLGPQIVCLGPVSPGGVVPERWMDGNQYLDAMLAELTPDDVDGFTLHAYGGPGNYLAALNDFRASYRTQLRLIDDRGFAHKPAYIFEFNRNTDPMDAGNEAETARFCIEAFQDLQAWNASPANHPIACACWFVYPADCCAWQTYSLVSLRAVNPRGVNQDVWDSFQYACSLNIPSGSSGPPAAAVVDNSAATTVGTWTTGTSAVDKYGTDYRYKGGGGTSSGNYAEFRPNLPGGTVNVYAWWSQGSNRGNAVPIAVTHAGGTSTVYVNQQTNGGKWNLLGTWTFNAGTGGYARLKDSFADSSKVAIADAFRFVTVMPADVVVDNASAGFTASANWYTATSAADKYGSDYKFRATAAVSDVATWNFTVPQNRDYEIYAWWSQGTNRAIYAPYIVTHSNGTVTVTRNQQTGGGAWQSLGTRHLLGGPNNVKLSCWTTTGYVVIADAIRASAR